MKLFSDYRLGNGLRVALSPLPSTPLVAADLWLGVGSRDEADETRGVTHFIEHMLFRGTAKRAPGQIDKEIEALGAFDNAETSHSWTHYYVTAPADKIEPICELMSDLVFHAKLDANEMEKEREVVLEEWRMGQDDPTTFLYDKNLSSIYKSLPYRHPVIGYKETIEKIKSTQMREYYQRFYTASNAILVLSGAFDEARAAKIVEKHFGDLPAKSVERDVLVPEQVGKKLVDTTFERNVQNTYFIMSFIAPSFYDMRRHAALKVLSRMLTGSYSSLLQQEMKNRRLVALSISSFLEEANPTDAIHIQGQIKFYGRMGYTVTKLTSLLCPASISRLGEDDLQRAKNSFEAALRNSRESALANAGHIGFFMNMGLDEKGILDYYRLIGSITLDDVRSVARDVFNERNRISLTVLKPTSAAEPTVTSFNISPLRIKAAEPEKPVPEFFRLKNGMTFFLFPVTETRTVAYTMLTLGGYGNERVPGEANIMQSMILKGTRRRDATGVSTLFENFGASVSAIATRDYFGAHAEVPDTAAEMPVYFFSELLTLASFPNSELGKMREEVRAKIRAEADDNVALARKYFRQIAFGTSRWGVDPLGTMRSIEAIKNDQLKEFFRHLYQPRSLVMTIVGNFNPKSIKKAINRRLALVKNQKFSTLKRAEPIRMVPSTTIKSFSLDREQTVIYVQFPAVSLANPDYIGYLFMNAVLGSGASSRLFRNLREKKSLAYTIGSELWVNYETGAEVIELTCANDKVTGALKAINDEIRQICNKGVTKAEFGERKEYILGVLKASQETNSDKSQAYASYLVQGLSVEWGDRTIARVQSLTHADMSDFLTRMKPYPLVVVTVGASPEIS